MKKYLKEGVFIALFIIIIVIIIGILFFEFIPNQIIPEPTKYQQSSSTAKLIAQIGEEQQAEQEKEENKSVLKSYEVTSEELDYSKNESDYIQGKNHPFYDYTKATASNTTSNAGSTSSNGSSNSSNIGNTTSSSQTNDINSNLNNTINTNNTNKINTNTLRDTTNSSTTSK